MAVSVSRGDLPLLTIPAPKYLPAPDLAVVTSYFNPQGYRSKRRAFDLFAAAMERSKVPLFVAECAFPGDSFQLADSSSSFRFRGGDVMWQKERLVNLAIERVPDRFTKIAWVDGDILFDNPSWPLIASERLERSRVIQLFATGLRLRPGQLNYWGAGESFRSFCWVHSALPAMTRFGTNAVHGHAGLAWAANRDFLVDVGLYDGAIVGGADHLMAHAFAGDFCSGCLPEIFLDDRPYLEHFRKWAGAAFARTRGELGFVPGAALHLWHGDGVNRRYYGRYQALADLGYDPSRHITAGPGDPWSWTSEAGAELRSWSAEYFRMRREDTPATAAVRS